MKYHLSPLNNLESGQSGLELEIEMTKIAVIVFLCLAEWQGCSDISWQAPYRSRQAGREGRQTDERGHSGGYYEDSPNDDNW